MKATIRKVKPPKERIKQVFGGVPEKHQKEAQKIVDHICDQFRKQKIATARKEVRQIRLKIRKEANCTPHVF
jgi:hypothetical protein